MAVTIIKKSGNDSSGVARSKARRSGHSKPLPINMDITQPGRLRVGHCLTLFSVSHASLYRGMGTKYPRPDGNDGRPYWNTSTLNRCLA